MTGFAEAVTGASNHLAHQALEAGHPGLPLLAILCLSVTCAIGLPGARPGDDRVSASILWWRLRIAAFAGALLFWLLTICHLVLAERLLGDGAARWFLVDWAGRWGLLGLALIGCGPTATARKPRLCPMSATRLPAGQTRKGLIPATTTARASSSPASPPTASRFQSRSRPRSRP